MEIREYYGAETVKLKKLSVSLFRAGNMALADEEKYAEELEKNEAQLPEGFIRLGAFDGEKLLAGVTFYPYTVYFDGTPVKMSGVGSVVRDVCSNEKGLVKSIFIEGFKKLKESNQILSHLYPFNADYYKQYGYEVSAREHVWRIPCEYIRNYSQGRLEFYNGDEKIRKDAEEVYRAFSSKYNLAIVRDEKAFDKIFSKLTYYTGKYMSYIHYTDEGKADAFMSYKVNENADRPQDLEVTNIWFTSYAGLRAILSYFRSQVPYCDRVIVRAPENVELAIFSEFQGGWAMRNTLREINYFGTTRVIDAEAILALAKCKGEGSICIEIQGDTYAPWNNGVFTLNFGKENRVVRGGTPDVTMSICAFSAMILGSVDFSDADIFADLTIHNQDAPFDKVFYRKNLFIDEHF